MSLSILFLFKSSVIFEIVYCCSHSHQLASLLPRSEFVLGRFSGEVLAAKLDNIGWVTADDFLGEVFEDLGELLGHHNLLSRENSHLTNVCHLLILLLNFSNLI